ncbi:MAG: cysteine desulfurase [Alphaproteobacteria bacterium]|nr:cysteine desulfurase [Alphaproteobacteria bacterium]
MTRIYLDHNATSTLRPEARAALLSALDETGNASSVHAEGRRARSRIETARGQVASLVGASPGEVIFTSGGSEANALALKGTIQAAAAAGERITRLIISAIEHDSIRDNAAQCEETIPGLRVLTCPVTPQGIVDIVALKTMLREGKGRALVSIMSANNETGVVQPLADVIAVAKAHNALVHTDAVQVAGKRQTNFAALGLDYMTLSAHKFGGPAGTGALIVRDGAPLARQIAGGAQELGRRAGTENMAAIAGFGAAAQAAAQDMSSWETRTAWRQALERALVAECRDAVIFGSNESRLPNTICIAAPSVPAENMVIALDLDGFAVSAGAACSSGKVAQSHVLTAMGVEPHLAQSAIRVSIGWNSTEQELTAFAEAWTRIVKRAQARVAA